LLRRTKHLNTCLKALACVQSALHLCMHLNVVCMLLHIVT